MKTNQKTFITMLPEDGRARDYEILLDDLEFVMPKKQLKEIKCLHNEGRTVKEIAKYEQRNTYEVILALLHLVKGGHAMKPFKLGWKGMEQQLSLFDAEEKPNKKMEIYLKIKRKSRNEIFLGDFMKWLSRNLDEFRKKNKLSRFKGLTHEQEKKFTDFLREEL